LFNAPVIFDADDVLTITVSGISRGGVATSISYKTEFFSMYPDKISDLRAAPGNRAVTLSWTAPDSAAAITRYEYRSRDAQAWSWGGWTSLPGTGTSHTITGLRNGSSYDFQVRAVSAVGAAEEASVSATLYDDIEHFVSRLLTIVLARDSYTRAGHAFWAGEIKGGRRTGVDLAYEFFFGQEFIGSNVSDAVFVTRLIQALMGREPNPAGVAHFVGRLEDGLPREYIFAEIAHSAEFSNLCNDAGITRGTFNLPQEMNVQVFTLKLFLATLERTPNAEGLNFWINELRTGNRTGARVAFDFIFSEEMDRRNLTDAQYIVVLCNALMGRNPSADGVTFWVNRMNTVHGGNRHSIFVEFINSAEFGQICADYGIVRGTAPSAPSPR